MISPSEKALRECGSEQRRFHHRGNTSVVTMGVGAEQ